MDELAPPLLEDAQARELPARVALHDERRRVLIKRAHWLSNLRPRD